MRKIAIVMLAGWVFGCGASAQGGTDDGQGSGRGEDLVVTPAPAPTPNADDAGTEPTPSKRPESSAQRHAPLPAVQ